MDSLSPEKRGEHTRNPHEEATPHLYDSPVYKAVPLQPWLFFLTVLCTEGEHTAGTQISGGLLAGSLRFCLRLWCLVGESV